MLLYKLQDCASFQKSTSFFPLLFVKPQHESAMKVKVAQSCLTLCYPMDYTVHGILQARILEWVAFLFSRGSSQPRDQTRVSRIAGIRILYQLSHQGSPRILKWVQVKVA